jgi:hypothetical protein
MHLLLTLALGCVPPQVGGSSPADSGGGTESDSTAPETGGDVEWIPGHEDTGPLDHGEPFPLDDEGCPAFYSQDYLPEIALDLSPEATALLEQDHQRYEQNWHPAVFTWQGDSWEAMVRLRGNTYPDKYELSISFNEVDPDGRFHGLRKVVLDGATYETTMLRNRVAAWWFRKHGVHAYCANNIKLTLNGSYFGLYSNTEDIDHEFLERSFSEDYTGTLYKEGTDPKSNDEAAIPEHAQAWAQATDPDVLATYLDIDDVMWAWGLEAALPNTDGFVYGYHNFYLYDHPESGFTWVPSDLDYTFDGSQHLDVQPFNVDPLTYYRCGNGPQFLLFRDDPDWRERYIAEIARAMDVYDEDELIARWAEWDAQIHQALQDDPNRLYDMATHDAHIADVQLFIQRRADFMREWVERNR